MQQADHLSLPSFFLVGQPKPSNDVPRPVFRRQRLPDYSGWICWFVLGLTSSLRAVKGRKRTRLELTRSSLPPFLPCRLFSPPLPALDAQLSHHTSYSTTKLPSQSPSVSLHLHSSVEGPDAGRRHPDGLALGVGGPARVRAGSGQSSPTSKLHISLS